MRDQEPSFLPGSRAFVLETFGNGVGRKGGAEKGVESFGYLIMCRSDMVERLTLLRTDTRTAPQLGNIGWRGPHVVQGRYNFAMHSPIVSFSGPRPFI
jgi:hypothetical protein